MIQKCGLLGGGAAPLSPAGAAAATKGDKPVYSGAQLQR